MRTSQQGLLTPEVPALIRVLFLAQIFTVFFTGVKLISGLRNNFGPFEILAGLLCVVFLLAYRDPFRRLRWHPLLTVQLMLSVAAAVSLSWFQGPSIQLGIVQTLILFFQFLFVLVNLNIITKYQISPEKLLRLVTYSALVIGPWILFAGLEAEGAIDEAGPFRNRAHMANYMLSAFWLVLVYNSWPGISRRERYISFLALASTLYPVAVSGRRSVYLSLIIGLIGVGFSFLVAARGRRRASFTAAVALLGFVALLYVAGPRWLPQLAFFQERVAGIGARLTMALGEDPATSDANFFELQRMGVGAAFRDYPIMGIGWGGYHRSRYSLTGAEVHSTPLRFLAELGIVGASLYAILMGILLLGSLRIVLLLRRTAYRTPAVLLAIAFWSLSVSYLYNRHVTERTYWLLLLFYVVFEAFAESLAKRLSQARAEPRPARPGWAPGRAAAALARPRGTR